MKVKFFKFISQIKIWWSFRSKKTKIFFGILIIFLLFFIFKNNNQNSSGLVETVKKQTLTQSVSASGSVISSTDLNLSFEQSKIVNSVRVFVGQKVTKNTILATLSNNNEWASVASAKGGLLSAQARYKKVIEGSSNEEISLAKVLFENSKIDLINIKKVQDGLVENSRRILNSSGLVAESSSQQSTNAPNISGIYKGDEGQYSLTLNFSGNDNSYISYSGIESGTVKASKNSPQALGTKGLFIVFSSDTIINSGGSWVVKIPSTSSNSYATNLNNFVTAQNNRDQAVDSAQAKVNQASAELNLKRATARQPDVDAALAEVITAQAILDQANANLEKTILRAPADGTITSVDIKVGELTQTNKKAIGLQDISNLYLEASINESNIKSVAVGQQVTVTFDAFSNDQYRAVISSIDPAATILNNVVNYKIKALLSDTKDIKPGMTANMTVIINQVQEAIVVPGRVVNTKDGINTVSLIVGKNNKTETKQVYLGIRGDGDLIEVKDGLIEGQKVLWVPISK